MRLPRRRLPAPPLFALPATRLLALPLLLLLLLAPGLRAQENGDPAAEEAETPAAATEAAEAAEAPAVEGQQPGAPVPDTAGLERLGLYRSNALGMQLEPLSGEGGPGAAVPREGFALMIREGRQGGALIREQRLYDGGRLQERLVRELGPDGEIRREWHFEDGTLQREEGFASRGHVRYRRDYVDGALDRETRYAYDGAEPPRLIRRRVLDSSGSEEYEDRLSYYPSGGLRELTRTWADGDVRRVRYSVVDGRVLQEHFLSDGIGRLLRYDANRRPVYEREYQGEETLEETEYRYEGDSRSPSASVRREPGEDRRVVRSLDEEGRVLKEEIYEEGRLVREVEHAYGPAGRTETVVTSRGLVERRTFAYEEGELVEERVFENGRLSRSIRYEGERSRVERRYRNGSVFARIYYEDDTAVREQILRNGRVVESRELR